MDLALESTIAHLVRQWEEESRTVEQFKIRLNEARGRNISTLALQKLQAAMALHEARANQFRGEAMKALASRR